MSHETSTIEAPSRDGGAVGVTWRRLARWHIAIFAVIAYVPLLLTHPGWIASDTKAYLYLDPEKLTRTARYLWNPDVGMGTVTHQNIGYLFPMGPWYWLFHELAVPTWIAQRLWMGTLLFAAATGVRYLAKLLGLSEWGQFAAALIYMLTPYILDYLARTSAILMPWAGLGWLVGFLIVAVRRGGWRYPALFALVVALIGGVNATSVLLVGLAPLLWVVLAGIQREARWRDVIAATAKAGLLSVLVSLWWVAGLWAEGSYGINVLKYTETFPTVTMTSMSSEILRGLGYWYFYGSDAIQPWTLASPGYMQHVVGLLLSFLVPVIALAGAALVRWRARLFAVLLVVVGVVLAVGAYPLSDPSPLGTLLRSLGEHSTIGLAMRSSNRVVPIVVLGLSLLAGSAIAALGRWRPTLAPLVAIAVGVLACANLAPLFEGNMVATNLMFPDKLPRYVTKAADFLNRSGTTAVLGIPGEDFGYYRWGVTMDSVWPGLLDRPYIARQAVLQGEPASANLLRALDESIQDGVFVPSTLAPIARLMGVGDILLQSDLQYERFDLPRPQALWLELHPTPSGLTYVRGFGSDKPVPTLVGTILDETQLMQPPDASYPPDLAVYAVKDPRALLRTESIQDPIVLDGDGSGILLAAQDGLLDGSQRAIVYAASINDTVLSHLENEPGVTLVLTDTNAKELDTWGTLHTTYGYVEQIGQRPIAYDPSEQSLPIFAHQTSADQTVLLVRGIRSVSASSYGAAPVANAPEDQPLAAIDGNPDTAWEVGAFSDPRGQFWRVTFDHPISISQLSLEQPQLGVRKRWASRVTLHFSSGPDVALTLGESSHVGAQTFHFATHRTNSLTITITGMTGPQGSFTGENGVGFAEVAIPGVGPVTSSLRLPTDLLGRLGSKGKDDPLVVLLHRLRAATVPPRTDPEPSMSRTFALPWSRSFAVTGSVSLSSLLDDTKLDSVLGRGSGIGTPRGELPHVVSTGDTTRLVGSLTNSSWAAFDGNPDTSWMPAFSTKAGQGFTAMLSGTDTLSAFDLQVVVDGRHSVPTSIRVRSSGGATETVPLTYAGTLDPHNVPQGTVEDVDVRLAPITGHTFTFTFPTERTLTTVDHIGTGLINLPIGIADVVLPGVAPATTPTAVPSGCLPGLLTVDGTDVAVRITGSTSDALDQHELAFTSCRGDVTLSSGTHVVQTAPGSTTGWNVDDVDLTSTPGTPSALTILPTARVTHVHWSNPVTLHATVGPQTHPSWLVLDQSFSTGWQATVDGVSLGAPELLDGGFTAWRLPERATSGTVVISWTPQQTVDDALLASLLGLAIVVCCIAWRPRRRRHLVDATNDPQAEPKVALPWEHTERPSPVLAGAATVIAMVIAGPAIVLLCAPLVALGWWRPRLRAVLALAPAAALGLCALYMGFVQYRSYYPHNIQWVAHFPDANTLGWIAVCLLLVDVAAFGGILTSRPELPRATGDASTVPAAEPFGPPPGGLRIPWPAWLGWGQHQPRPPKDRPSGAQSRLARVIPARWHGPLAVLVPSRFGAKDEPPDIAGTIISLPGSGITRSVALLRAFKKEQSDPDFFYRTLALDTLHRLTGATPLFNRTVLDVGGGPGYFGEAFRTAGARVVLVEPEAAEPLPSRLDMPDELLDEAERHERAVWPGRLLEGDTIAGDGLALPLPDDSFDLVFSSNVLEHVVDPRRFLDEAVRVARPGGLVYLSYTVWHSPWGGHETSPWHLVSGRYALQRYTRRHGHSPKNVIGESLFPVSVRTVLRLLAERNDVEVVALEPRYYPDWARFIVRVPILRELLTWNLVVLLEKL